MIPINEVDVATPRAQSHASAEGCRRQVTIGYDKPVSSEIARRRIGEKTNIAMSGDIQWRDFMGWISL
jgi:hypothetical protein